ncbi:hypothetical protein [Hyphococcus sp.]|jgi:hypothetical protein|uniref:hypothetical protein n=1 Tax=Hyphococcus sp. TaxID=2038636 RepID=UPI003D0E9FFC
MGVADFSNGFLIVQAGVLLVTILALVGSMMFAKRAVKAASFMREAQKETQALYGSIDRQMQTMQMMSDELRRMADDVAQRHDELSAGFKAETIPPVIAGDGSAAPEDAPAHQELASEDLGDAEKKPSALFRSLLRRR